MCTDLYSDLVEKIKSKRVVAVVGSGVSVSSSENSSLASWIGLLRNGIKRTDILSRATGKSWREQKEKLLEDAESGSGDIDEILLLAELISRKLGAPDDGEWRRWLRESVGALTPASDSRLLRAIVSLGVPIATTNYDSLLETITQFPAITWRKHEEAVRVLTGEEKGILHLHGYWKEPDTVILGIRDYAEIQANQMAQFLQRVLPTLNSLLFIGCGSGLYDPNFNALRAWMRTSLKSVEHRHFRLARDGDVKALQRSYHPAERTYVLGFGADFSDLPSFLERLSAAAYPHPLSTGEQQPIALPLSKDSSERLATAVKIAEQCMWNSENISPDFSCDTMKREVALSWFENNFATIFSSSEILFVSDDYVNLGKLADSLVQFILLRGHFDQCEKIYTRCLDLRESHKDDVGRAQTLNDLAICYQFMGDFHRAQEHLEKAINIEADFSAQQLEQSAYLLPKSWNSLGMNYQRQVSELNVGTLSDDWSASGDALLQKAEDCYTNAREICKRQLDHLNVSAHKYSQKVLNKARDILMVELKQTASNMGFLLTEKALRLFDKAEREFENARQPGSNPRLGQTLSRRARLYLARDHLDDARREYEEAIRKLTLVNDHYELGVANMGLGDVHFRQGRLNDAEKCYMTAKEHLQESSDELIQCYLKIVELFDKKGDEGASQEFLRLAEELLEQFPQKKKLLDRMQRNKRIIRSSQSNIKY